MHLRFIILALVVGMALLLAQNAFAKEECPPGFVSYVNTETYQSVCLRAGIEEKKIPELVDVDNEEDESDETEDESDDEANDTSEEDDGMIFLQPYLEKRRAERAAQNEYQPKYQPKRSQAEQEAGRISSGFQIELGVGYALYQAFDFHFMFGYTFEKISDIVSFGIYTDLDVIAGIPNALDWAVVPMIHLNGSEFRGSFGLGFGLFSLLPNNSRWRKDYDTKDDLYFIIKPEFRFDWFISHHVYCGAGVDIPFIILTDLENKNTGLAVWFDIHLYVGYKF